VDSVHDHWCVALLADVLFARAHAGELCGSRAGCWRWALAHRTEHDSLPTGRASATAVTSVGAGWSNAQAPRANSPPRPACDCWRSPHRVVWILASTDSEPCQTPTQSRHGLRPRHRPGYSSLRGVRRMTRSTLSRIPAPRSRVQARRATPPTATTIASHGGARSRPYARAASETARSAAWAIRFA
jgi:hypothetical protein